MAEQDIKRWGPFSGRQLTTIIVALMAAVVLPPVAAFGVVKAKPFFITDNATGARVTGGKLSVDTGLAATGSVNVSGSVSATPAPTTQLWTTTQSFVRSGNTVVTPPAGKAVVITEMHIIRYGGPRTGYLINVTGHTLGYWDFSETDPTSHEVNFPTGVVVKNGDTATFQTEGAVDANYLISFYGYTVPAATCAAANTCGY